MKPSLRIVLQSVLRMIVGMVLFLLPASLFLVDARSGVGVAEGNYVETAQFGALVLSCILMAIAACRSKRRADGLATALLCVALGMAFMAVRELDGYFDKAVAHGSWKIFATPFAICAVAVVLCRRMTWLDSIATLLETRTGFLLELFLLTLLVFSRTFGIKQIWSELFTNTTLLQLTEQQIPFAARITKNAVEEVSELFAYMLLVAASIQALLEGRGGRCASSRK